MSKKIVYSKYTKQGVTVDKTNATKESTSGKIEPMKYIDKKQAEATSTDQQDSNNTYARAVLAFVKQRGAISSRDLEGSQIGTLTKQQIRFGVYILLYSGELEISDDLKLVPSNIGKRDKGSL